MAAVAHPNRTSELLNVQAVAAILGCQPDMVYILKDRGQLEYVRVGRLVRFTRAAVDNYIATNTARVDVLAS